MADSTHSIDDMVKAFLATRDLSVNGRADIVFDEASVEGAGKGVNSQALSCGSMNGFLTHLHRYKRLQRFERPQNLW